MLASALHVNETTWLVTRYLTTDCVEESRENNLSLKTVNSGRVLTFPYGNSCSKYENC